MPVSTIPSAGLDTNTVAPFATSFTTIVGSAPSYACRAWVNFNGVGTVAIRASGNVSSITDIGVGNYNVNLTTAMPDVSYSAVVTPTREATATGCLFSVVDNTSSLLKIVTRDTSTTNVDCSVVSLAIFR